MGCLLHFLLLLEVIDYLLQVTLFLLQFSLLVFECLSSHFGAYILRVLILILESHVDFSVVNILWVRIQIQVHPDEIL